eukprot:7521220-Heterocapsa_arctica.AAC.1
MDCSIHMDKLSGAGENSTLQTLMATGLPQNGMENNWEPYPMIMENSSPRVCRNVFGYGKSCEQESQNE